MVNAINVGEAQGNYLEMMKMRPSDFLESCCRTSKRVVPGVKSDGQTGFSDVHLPKRHLLLNCWTRQWFNSGWMKILFISWYGSCISLGKSSIVIQTIRNELRSHRKGTERTIGSSTHDIYTVRLNCPSGQNHLRRYFPLVFSPQTQQDSSLKCFVHWEMLWESKWVLRQLRVAFPKGILEHIWATWVLNSKSENDLNQYMEIIKLTLRWRGSKDTDFQL